MPKKTTTTTTKTPAEAVYEGDLGDAIQVKLGDLELVVLHHWKPITPLVPIQQFDEWTPEDREEEDAEDEDLEEDEEEDEEEEDTNRYLLHILDAATGKDFASFTLRPFEDGGYGITTPGGQDPLEDDEFHDLIRELYQERMPSRLKCSWWPARI